MTDTVAKPRSRTLNPVRVPIHEARPPERAAEAIEAHLTAFIHA